MRFNKFLLFFCIFFAIISAAYLLINRNIIKLPEFATVSYGEGVEVITTIEELTDGSYYVWHNPNQDDIQVDMAGTTDPDVFMVCPKGVINWDKNDWVTHTVWFSSEEDGEIPTYYPGDALLFISSKTVPYDGISWERFADYGYSIGVSNLIGDKSGHYHIVNSNDSGYLGYLNPEADAYQLSQYTNISELFLDKVEETDIREEQVSAGGTVLDLEKDESYLCQFYTGTYFQDFYLQANQHSFCSLESFTTYDYEFLHTNCISIVIPEWLKTGYYYINGVGLFRYLAEADSGAYNGDPYDPVIDWNDPIILYDENGFVIYDPTNPDSLVMNQADPGVADEEIGEEIIVDTELGDNGDVEGGEL